MIAWDEFRHGPDNLCHFRRLGTTIGIAKNDPSRASVISHFRTGKRIVRVGFVAIEEMLAIDNGFLASFDSRLH